MCVFYYYQNNQKTPSQGLQLKQRYLTKSEPEPQILWVGDNFCEQRNSKIQLDSATDALNNDYAAASATNRNYQDAYLNYQWPSMSTPYTSAAAAAQYQNYNPVNQMNTY